MTINKVDRVMLTCLVLLIVATFFINQPRLTARIVGKILDMTIGLVVALEKGVDAMSH